MKKLTKQFIGWLTVLIFVSIGASANAEFTTRELNQQSILALSWVQNSAEFKALAFQAFNLAKLRWDMDQQQGKKCVVVDVDETILDNSPFNAGLIGRDYGYNNSSWKEWCDAAIATAIPGAVDFLNHVVSTGGAVFYITNRKAEPEKNMDLTQVTLNNLRALGFPQIDKEHVLLRTGFSNKQPRRDAIARMGFRTVLLIGDTLADFADVFDGQTMEERDKAVEMNKAEFGDRFIVLPNPIYGDWETAVYGGGDWYKKTAKEKSDIRMNTLRKFNFSK
ncbi:MAG: 5'-nucleotidase, lipoprotein e(P4) family [Proteobacteria bacterium]|nr:5'-nucleotidase, lipoprotein e(P4) family [Pseudomonadota bacterium]MBU1584580.1 5'-nucleotidase, lipoprotein e(P4) family [Pseudomonadota bacterium]MBU2451747.1 5'-nucleotidase, lipoprotein e(P4) family [Pseudomonadota bacterium]MBU2631307.1 5'-nucleotidase, lipoprotein e(P4) family [Pseudomonadota bacterium]